MSLLMTALGSVLVAAGASDAAPPPISAADTVQIREWEVPWAYTRPRGHAVDAQGRVWFVGQRGNYVGVLDPRSGEMRRFDLPERALPHNIVVGPGGDFWYAGNGDTHIGRMDPETGKVRRYSMPDSAARDPHTLAFAPAGDLWFTVQGGNFVGRMDPASMRMKEYSLPWEDARPRRLARTSDGMVWYADHARGTLGRLDPATGEAKEWATPGGADSRPYAMTVDDRDRLWFVETGPEPNRMVGFDPRSGEFLPPHPHPERGQHGAPHGISPAHPLDLVRHGRQHRAPRDAPVSVPRGWLPALGLVPVLLVGATGAAVFLEGPPPAHTGGFGEPTCAQCHFDVPEPDPAGSQAGAVRAVDGRAAVTAYRGVDYVHHTAEGTKGAAPGDVRWRVEWTAPAHPTGPVVFHLAGNAADGDESQLGDHIYADSVRVEPSTKPSGK